VMHCSVSFLKCCETLSFLVRDVVHITPENFSSCVAAIRTFVEASYRGDTQGQSIRRVSTRSAGKKTPRTRAGGVRTARTEPRHGGYEADDSSDDELVGEYTHVTMQLLDLMHVLHTRAMGVQTAWERDTMDLWDLAWCPVLQGMARLCCDTRPSVRTQALTLLQRSLLVSDLQVLTPGQWEFAFLRVLFPMLRKLLEMGGTAKPDQGREETKLRAAMMLSKVFLQHLGPLSSLPTFTALWLTILDLVGQFCATASTDILADALPESLKNMLLVMDTSGRDLFFSPSGHPTTLWGVTWGKIDTFLPGLREELFPGWEKRAEKKLESEDVANKTVDVNAEMTEVDAKQDNVAEATAEENTAQEPPASSNQPEQPASTAASIPSFISPAPVIASLTTTAPPSSMLSNYFLSTQVGRERNPSLPDTAQSGTISPSPVSPMDPPTLPFTAFSLPTSPSHAPSSLFSPITPAPPLLTTPSAPVAVPRPVIPAPQTVQPTHTAPKHSNPLLPQTGDTTAFTTPSYHPYQPPLAR